MSTPALSPPSLIAEKNIAPITPRIGAEILDVKLGGDIDDSAITTLKDIIARYKVVFFRNQHHVDDKEHERLARHLGELLPHPTQPIFSGSSSILELDSDQGTRADQWHTDITFLPSYPKYSILRNVTSPEIGGDTLWANTAAAYTSLPDPLKSLAESLNAVHSNAYDYAAQRPHAREIERKHYEEVFRSTVFETEHPLVHVHPETGEKNLLLGSFVQRIQGLDRFDSARLYELFQRYVTAPENTVRWHWQAGDIALWDNRATQHIAVNDYGDAHRIVRRVTVAGEIPVGVDGRRSKPIR